MKELLPEGFHEVNFKNDVYEGTADLIVPCTKHDAGLPHGQFDLYDFKYGSCYRNGVHEPKLYSDYGMFLWSGI